MSKKVLIIEDSATDAAIVKELLIKEGIEVTVATSGNEGLKTALKIKPDLVILDLILPDISGFEVCFKIKREVSLSKTTVIMLTVKDNANDIKKAFHVEADDYIIKPPEPELLVKKMKEYLDIS